MYNSALVLFETWQLMHSSGAHVLPASEMTYIVSGGALDSTHSLTWSFGFFASYVLQQYCRHIEYGL